jgi:hypothetical protein
MDHHVPLTPSLKTHPMYISPTVAHSTLAVLYHPSTMLNLDYQSYTTMNYNNKMMNDLVHFL